MPDFDGFPLHTQISGIKFEAAVYDLLRSHPDIKISKLLYHRPPCQHEGPRKTVPKDILGRHLMVFEQAKGRNEGASFWRGLWSEHQLNLVAQAAIIRAALFNFEVPADFASEWLRERLSEQKPESIDVPVAGTRDFCVALFIPKIQATIRSLGDMIGWESDNDTVGPRAAAAKQSLSRFIPHMLPEGTASNSGIYQLVLEHGDFGIHNITIASDGPSPEITSVFDWEVGCIVPALLSDTLMSTLVDLRIDENGQPSITRVGKSQGPEDISHQKALTEHYHKVLFEKAPDYQKAIQAGKNARHLWFALRDWRGDDPEGHFWQAGRLGGCESEGDRGGWIGVKFFSLVDLDGRLFVSIEAFLLRLESEHVQASLASIWETAVQTIFGQ